MDSRKLSFEDWWAQTNGANDIDNWRVYSNPTTLAKTAARAAWNAALAQQAQPFHCIECEGDASPLPHVCNPQQAQPRCEHANQVMKSNGRWFCTDCDFQFNMDEKWGPVAAPQPEHEDAPCETKPFSHRCPKCDWMFT